MMQLEISNSELSKLKALLRKERRKNGCPKKALKINIIIALAKGWSIVDIVDAFELDEETVRNYLQKYKNGKLKGLLNQYYVGSESKLTEEQQNILKEELRNNLYNSTFAVQVFVLRKFKINYSRTGMTKLLHKLGFSYKKPKKFVFKTPIEEQEKFIKETIEPLLSNSDDENYFMDSAHPTIQTENSYGWFECGKETVLSSQGLKQRLNLIGSVKPNGEKILLDYPEQVDTDAIVKHLLKIERTAKCKGLINVFLDNAAVHVKASKNPKIEARKRLNLIFLPSYSPNLNLAERLWFMLRKDVINNQFFDSINDLKDKINRKIYRWRAKIFNAEIYDIFKPKFHLYKNANVLFT